jgi:predicted ester cyclase
VSQANIDASRRVIEEAFSGGRLEVLDEVCAENCVSHDPLTGDQGLAEMKQSISMYRDAFPDLTFTVDDAFAADDKVMGLQPTHEKGSPIHGISIDRFDENGKLVETWGQWETLTLMRDIGAIPEAASAGAPG